ncbi:hypothetical protein [Streptomyces sp. NPDC005970]|uniref:hypothetical protein n=1 Tax=Streptomyces sp. NPDC005970 TaxID=3156723 RepID=UPI00340CD0FF
MAGVRADTISNWVREGKLTVIGKRKSNAGNGLTNLFNPAEVHSFLKARKVRDPEQETLPDDGAARCADCSFRHLYDRQQVELVELKQKNAHLRKLISAVID